MTSYVDWPAEFLRACVACVRGVRACVVCVRGVRACLCVLCPDLAHLTCHLTLFIVGGYGCPCVRVVTCRNATKVTPVSTTAKRLLFRVTGRSFCPSTFLIIFSSFWARRSKGLRPLVE